MQSTNQMYLFNDLTNLTLLLYFTKYYPIPTYSILKCARVDLSPYSPSETRRQAPRRCHIHSSAFQARGRARSAGLLLQVLCPHGHIFSSPSAVRDGKQRTAFWRGPRVASSVPSHRGVRVFILILLLFNLIF